MVKRKSSRAQSKDKEIMPKIKINDDSEEEEIRKETHLKWLDDFDMQVRDILLKMEADKQATIASIKHLYYVDEQRTPEDVNNMLWTTFLNQNMPCPRSEIRESIAELVLKVEDQQLMTGKRKRGRRKVSRTPGDPVIATRSRQPKICYKDSETETPMLSAVQRPHRGRKNFDSTPVNQIATAVPASLLITPKFDPRAAIPAESLRKPKYGEIAVSLQGSPLIVPAKKDSPLTNLTNLDAKTREELMELHNKVSKMLNI